MRILAALIIGVLAGAGRCAEPSECVRLAMPLLSENQLVVPSTRTELKMVCNKWHEFVDCINSYVARHYSSQQKSSFNQDVETAVKNVYKMCKDPIYSEEYLLHAPCIKQMTTERGRCGTYYTNMARAVTEGIGSDQNICCLHHKFRSCMSEQTPCDGSRSSPAVLQGFVETFLDNGLHVFKQKCSDMQYVFRSDHCAGARQTRLEDEPRRPATYEDRPARPSSTGGRPERPRYDNREERPVPPRYDNREERPVPPRFDDREERPAPPRYDNREERPVPNRENRPEQVEQHLEKEHRGSLDSAASTARPSARGTTTPYAGWFRPETTTSVWLDGNALDDRAQARRQDNGAPQPAAGSLMATLTAAVLTALVAR